MWRQRVSFLTIRMVLNHITVDKNVLSASLNKTFLSLSRSSSLKLRTTNTLSWYLLKVNLVCEVWATTDMVHNKQTDIQTRI